MVCTSKELWDIIEAKENLNTAKSRIHARVNEVFRRYTIAIANMYHYPIKHHMNPSYSFENTKLDEDEWDYDPRGETVNVRFYEVPVEFLTNEDALVEYEQEALETLQNRQRKVEELINQREREQYERLRRKLEC